MHIGHYISGGAHAGLIFWALFGGMFQPDPIPLEVSNVSVISSEEFDAITAAYQAPAVETDAPDLTQDAQVDPAPDLTSQPDEQVASLVPPSRPEQQVEVTQPAPVEPLETPQVEPETPVQPEPPQEVAPDLPVTAAKPAPRPADRVAPEAVAPPPEDATIADDVQDSVTLSDAGQVTDAPEQEATAPEAATTEIITEAKDPPSGAPKTSLRPRPRPAEPTPAEPKSEDTPKVNSSSVNSALAEALTDDTPKGPTGPPMTRGEKDGFRVAVQQCWVVDVGSEAANVTVTIAMELDKNGVVDAGSLKLIASEGGTDSAINTAFSAARRAILRCQKDGYKLPIDKYDQWREIEITFNPEDMRTR